MVRLDRQVAVFARAPVLGRVKTRLALEVGEEEALRIYDRLLHDTLKTLCGASFPVALYGDGQGLEEIGQSYGMEVRMQRGEDLGERMANAFAELLGEVRAVALVGVDIPLLEVNYLERAFEMLEFSDLVLGPAEDGGYCLIALKAQAEALFQDMPWGGSEVCARTLARARDLGLSARLAEPLWDVDRVEDVVRLRSLGDP